MDNENKSEKDEEGILKSKYYFDLKVATNEVSSAFGAKETLGAGAKLLGKSVFNVGLFTGKLAVEIAKELPNAIASQAQKNLNRSDLSSEQREKLEEIASRRK